MAAINDLISQIENQELRERILAELDKMNKQKKFGLVFEEHLPESVKLYDLPVKKGATVMEKAGGKSVYKVVSMADDIAECVDTTTQETKSFPVADIVPVALFGTPIFPYLKPLDSICNAPDSNLWHTLIEADNYHALQLLEYLYAGKVDCIYIDPPYNTGARDWKYNNDYVDGADEYRHSKWLSFMQRRLALAKKLLNPKDSVLIVTIDEKEYLHLGCLLEQMFPEARIQMVTDVINPSGSSRRDLFSRCDEYIYFILFGNASVSYTTNNMLYAVEERKARWDGLVRRGESGKRSARPNLFYPLFFSKETGQFMGVGDSLPLNMSRNEVVPPEGCFALFPLSANGEEARWGIDRSKFMEKYNKGYIRFGKWEPGTSFRTVAHLQEGMIAALERGEIDIQGKDADGAYILGTSEKPVTPMTTWVQQSHSAGDFGTRLLKAFFPSSRFSFPKSLYAVRDTLRFFVAKKPDALILDFFAGSGTTLHAVNLLNLEDGGHRRCIMVTNNEVSDNEAKSLTQQGFKPGDDSWEKLGVARYVTWPRIVCCIKGEDINGKPIKGTYYGSNCSIADGFKANAIFFKLGFLDKNAVALGRQFQELMPVLWMKAGAIGPCPQLTSDNLPDWLILPENKMAVLIDDNQYFAFKEEMEKVEGIDTLFIITDFDREYTIMANELGIPNTIQLYRDYLDNFRINHSR